LNNSVEMPVLGLGVFQTPPDETRDAVRAALGARYRHIDTAAAYGNERREFAPVRKDCWFPCEALAGRRQRGLLLI
jgi:aryl-alcohol dehydrogenase-like predicted oxidoreductase